MEEFGIFQTPCEGMLVYMATNKTMVPKFNKPVYTKDIKQIGKIDEGSCFSSRMLCFSDVLLQCLVL